jgi:hypothetical protein
VTVTAKIYSAATSPSEVELARRYLANDFTQRFHAGTAPPFDVTDYSTKGDVWTTPYEYMTALVLSFDTQVRIAQTAFDSLYKTALQLRTFQTAADDLIKAVSALDEMNLSARQITAIPGDPAQTIYRFVSADDHATDPTPIASILDSVFGKPQIDRLDGYEQYSQTNWDGHNAEPITAETLQYARWLLKVIPETFGQPDIAPSADGSIGLEWVLESGSLHKLFLDIGPGREWRAYWNRRNGEFGRLPGRGFSPITKQTLQKLFNDLSR